MGGFIYALTTAGCTANGAVAGFGFLAKKSRAPKAEGKPFVYVVDQ